MSQIIRFSWDDTAWEAKVADGEVVYIEAICPTFDARREIRTRAELLYRWGDLMLLRQQALDAAQDMGRAQSAAREASHA